MKNALWVWLAVISCFFSLSPVFARDTRDLLEMKTEELFELSLEELLDVEITSAGKMSEKVGEIPASVYIVTRDDIEKYGYRTVAEVIRNIPGFYSIHDYRNDVIGLRGVLNENNMIVLVNGVVQHGGDINEIMIPAESIDRIEVVRGPMSVIYGSGAFLGSINIVTNHIPYGDPLRLVSGSYGSLGTYKAFTRVSGEETDFRYVLNASVYTTDGIDESYRSMWGPTRYERIMDNYPSAHLNTDGDLFRKNQDVNLSAALAKFSFDLQFDRTHKGIYEGVSFFDGSESENEIFTASMGYSHDLSSSVDINGKLTFSNSDSREHYDYYPPDIFGEQAAADAFAEEKRLEAELDIIWKPSEKFTGITGINYKVFFDTSYGAEFPVNPDMGFTRAEASYKLSRRDIRSVFAQFNHRPTERLKLTAGLRVEQYMDFDGEARIQYEESPVTFFDEFDAGEELYFIPRLAAIYSLSDHHIFKLMYGQANKRPSYIELALLRLENAVIEELEPETIRTYELNYLMTYKKFGISLSMFKNRYDRLRSIEFEQNDEGETFPVLDNSGKMVTYGSEIIVTAHPCRDLNLELSATYQNTLARGEKEIPVVHSPHWLAKAKADYTWRGFTLGASALYVDGMEPRMPKVVPGGGAFDDSDDYITVDLNLRYKHEETGIFTAFRISNLFDTEIRYPATENAQFRHGLIGEARTFLATIGWEF